MPIHDWTRVEAVIFQDFRGYWIQVIKRALNDGLLPNEYYAITERVNIQPDTPRQNHLAIRHISDDRVVAVIEIVSPGNKDGKHALRSFVSKAIDLLSKRIHLLVIDLFPPILRDPAGIIASIQKESVGTTLELPADKPLTLAAYEAELPPTTYVDSLAISDELPT